MRRTTCPTPITTGVVGSSSAPVRSCSTGSSATRSRAPPSAPPSSSATRASDSASATSTLRTAVSPTGPLTGGPSSAPSSRTPLPAGVGTTAAHNPTVMPIGPVPRSSNPSASTRATLHRACAGMSISEICWVNSAPCSIRLGRSPRQERCRVNHSCTRSRSVSSATTSAGLAATVPVAWTRRAYSVAPAGSSITTSGTASACPPGRSRSTTSPATTFAVCASTGASVVTVPSTRERREEGMGVTVEGGGCVARGVSRLVAGAPRTSPGGATDPPGVSVCRAYPAPYRVLG